MLAKRIIPCLDVRNGLVVKGVNFQSIKEIESPVKLAEYYSENGADELVFYDITASYDNRRIFTDILKETAKNVFIPLTVGGGINTVDDFENVLNCGADKVSVNSGAINNRSLIREAAYKYGCQCVVLSCDIKRVEGEFKVFSKGGRINTGIDAFDWIRFGVDEGAGELVINSIDTDGVKNGFDIELLSKICDMVNVPVIASGGAGKMADFLDLFKNVPKISAGLAASVFHYGEMEICDLKRYLIDNDINVRI